MEDFIANKEMAGEEHIKATDMLGIVYKMPIENKNKTKLKDGKKQDLRNLDHRAKTKIGENNTEELRDVKQKKDRPLLVSINYKVMNMFVSNKTRSTGGKKKAGKAEESKRVSNFLKDKIVTENEHIKAI